MAKGNDGNYLQHSVESSLCVHLAREADGKLHLCSTHGMAPFEACPIQIPNGQTRRLLDDSLKAAAQPPQPGEEPVIQAYRATAASRKHYPNTGEVVSGLVGRGAISGGITDTDANKVAALAGVWQNSDVTPSNQSWRAGVGAGGVLACLDNLDRPWLFTMDPMTYVQGGGGDDNKIRDADANLLVPVLTQFAQSGFPGVAAVFVYAVRPPMRAGFWNFADDLAQAVGMNVSHFWITHQGGNRNLAAILTSHIDLSDGWVPTGINIGRE